MNSLANIGFSTPRAVLGASLALCASLTNADEPPVACDRAASIAAYKEIAECLQRVGCLSPGEQITTATLTDFAVSTPRFTETAFSADAPAWSWNLTSTNEKTRGKVEIATKGNAKHRFSLSVAGNISEDSSEDAVLTSLDGLSVSGEVGVSYTFTRIPPHVFSSGSRESRVEALQARIAYEEFRCGLLPGVVAALGGDSTPSAAHVTAELNKACAADDQCQSLLRLSAAADVLDTDDAQNQRVSRFTIAGTYGRPTFSTFDTETFDTSKDTKSAYQVEAGYRFFPWSYEHRVDFKLLYGRKYNQAGSSKEFCFPVGESGLLECVDAKTTGPTKAKTRGAQLSYGKFTDTSFIKGFELILTYEDTDESFGFQAPLYMFEHKEFGLNGGVRMNYVSKDTQGEEDFRFELFFGQSLSLF